MTPPDPMGLGPTDTLAQPNHPTADCKTPAEGQSVTRTPIDRETTRPEFLREGAGAVADAALTETALAFSAKAGEPSVIIKRDGDDGVAHVDDGFTNRLRR